MELPDTKTLKLKWPDGHDPDFKTGQFITLYWPDTPTYKRAYSLSSCALDRGFYEVTVKRDGKMGTRIVDWAKAGDKLFVIPPVGKFLPVYEPNKHLVCIAGGSGVTPFRAFVREATRRKLDTKITVLYSVRPPEGHHFQHGIPRAGKGESEFQIPRHLHARDAGGQLDRPQRAHHAGMDQGTRTRSAQHRFLRLRPERAGGFRRGTVVHGLACPRTDEDGKMGIGGSRIQTDFRTVLYLCVTEPVKFMLKRTALFSAHQKLGAKLIDFGGWEMPVQYTSITDEHLAVRNAAGIFDISHMGEVTVSGAGAADFLNPVLTNDVRKLAPGQGQYTLMCNERGGVIDDLYAYQLSDERLSPHHQRLAHRTGRRLAAGAGREHFPGERITAHRRVASITRPWPCKARA